MSFSPSVFFFFEISPRSLKTVSRGQQLVTSDLFLYPNECEAYTSTEERKAKQSQKIENKTKKKKQKEKRKQERTKGKGRKQESNQAQQNNPRTGDSVRYKP